MFVELRKNRFINTDHISNIYVYDNMIKLWFVGESVALNFNIEDVDKIELETLLAYLRRKKWVEN